MGVCAPAGAGESAVIWSSVHRLCYRQLPRRGSGVVAELPATPRLDLLREGGIIPMAQRYSRPGRAAAADELGGAEPEPSP